MNNLQSQRVHYKHRSDFLQIQKLKSLVLSTTSIKIYVA